MAYVDDTQVPKEELKKKVFGCSLWGCLIIPAFIAIPGLIFWVNSYLHKFSQAHWTGQLVIVGLAALVHVGSQRFFAYQVDNRMRKELAQLQGVEGAVEEPSTHQVVDVAPETTGSTLSFVTYGADATDLIDNEQEEVIQNQLLNRPGRLFLRGILIGVGVSLIAGIGITYFTSEPPEEALEVFKSPELASLISSLFQLIPHVSAAVLALFVYFRYFRIGIGTAIGVGVVANLFNFMFLLDSSGDYESLPAWAGVLPFGLYLFTVGVFGVIAFQLTKSTFIKSSAPRLLVLRVFGLDKNTTSLFHNIGRRWSFLGPLLTIVDPTYAKFEFKQLQVILITIVLLPTLIFISTFPLQPQLWGFFLLTGVSIYIPLLLVVLGFRLFRINDEASRGVTALKHRVASANSSLFSSYYKQARLLCYGDFWKTALDELLNWTDVVLMDLRGFSPSNKGCEYELNILLNRIELKRVVFLVNADTDQNLLRTFLSERWKELSPHSPNYGAADPVVSIFAQDQSKRNLKNTWVPLLALLSDRTASISLEHKEESVTPMDSVMKQLKMGVIASWCVVLLGVILQFTVNLDGMVIYSGFSVAWMGVILLMLSTRLQSLYKRDGHLKNIFQGFPWPQVFALLAFGWFMLYIWVGFRNGTAF